MSATVLYSPGEAKPARLFVWDGTRTMRTVDLQSGMVMGRAMEGTDVDLPLTSSIVSRHHGEFLMLEEGWCCRDLGSLNGTHVNGELYGREGKSDTCLLQDGDVLRIDRKTLDRAHPDAVVMVFSTSWQDTSGTN